MRPLINVFWCALLACPFFHPPNIEEAKKLSASITEVGGVWHVVLRVDYSNKKSWKKSIPARFETLKDAVDYYEKWRIHVLNVVHAEKEDKK